MVQNLNDYYSILQVPRSATEQDILDAYRKRARETHPDVNPGKDDSEFKRVNEAFQILSDQQERAAYDRQRDNVFGRRSGAASGAGYAAGNFKQGRGSEGGFGQQRRGRSGNRVRISLGPFGNIYMDVGDAWQGFEGAADLERTIDASYNSEGISEVQVNCTEGDVQLGLSSDSRIYVRGNLSGEPIISGTKLIVDSLENMVSVNLPRNRQGVKINVTSCEGTVSGDVAHPGQVNAAEGNINVRLHGPLDVLTAVREGSARVSGSKPYSSRPAGTLHLSAAEGNITAVYV